jgi:carbamoyl-phosphate synthase large subunit
MRRGATIEDVHARTSIDPWFLHELEVIAHDPQAPFAGHRSYRAVDTCAAEFEAATPYFYSAGSAPPSPRSSARAARAS